MWVVRLILIYQLYVYNKLGVLKNRVRLEGAEQRKGKRQRGSCAVPKREARLRVGREHIHPFGALFPALWIPSIQHEGGTDQGRYPWLQGGTIHQPCFCTAAAHLFLLGYSSRDAPSSHAGCPTSSASVAHLEDVTCRALAAFKECSKQRRLSYRDDGTPAGTVLKTCWLGLQERSEQVVALKMLFTKPESPPGSSRGMCASPQASIFPLFPAPSPIASRTQLASRRNSV